MYVNGILALCHVKPYAVIFQVIEVDLKNVSAFLLIFTHPRVFTGPGEYCCMFKQSCIKFVRLQKGAEQNPINRPE